ncbi:hypothetical protein LTR84_001482 [Exophiala bonariae]|uniref:CAP-Gly domain-containing protein n=1 Tax=Exophiala bonariae TaxID=1690606 RepID=A0AAV9NCT4_9EURO|nr:hypothetical protein LTR84_001482 [Exophiala bonariae]
MDDSPPYIGQRRSYAAALCTVRYHGPLSGTKGAWLGVEWDDPSRGKHDGKHNDQRIFDCLSSSPTAASFVRPSRKPDPERTLLEAIRFKYGMSKTDPRTESAETETTPIAISGKVVEEVGFEKIQKQLSVLGDLRIVLVDELIVSGVARRDATTQEVEDAQEELSKTCPSLIELDVGWNTIENWQDVADMSLPFKKLKILKASGLRLHNYQRERFAKKDRSFQNVEELHLSECLLKPEQVIQILSPSAAVAFPALRTLRLASNAFDSFTLVARQDFPTITTIVFDNNNFKNLADLLVIFALFPNTSSLSFQGNSIFQIGLNTVAGGKLPVFEKLESLNLTGNHVQNYNFINTLPTIFPNLKSLRISRNPLYETVAEQDPQKQHLDSGKQAQPQRGPQSAGAQSDSISYYLTLARIPKLESLNHTTITTREREEGEIYYLSTVEKEISASLDTSSEYDEGSDIRPSNGASSTIGKLVDSIRLRHPLYANLCIKYDRDDLLDRAIRLSQANETAEATDPGAEISGGVKTKIQTYAPGTLGARLVDAFFYVPPTKTGSSSGDESSTPTLHFNRALPTTISVYRLKSLVARAFSLPPLQFKLVYESHEYDPVEPISRNTGANNDVAGGKGQRDDKQEWDAWGDWDVDSSEPASSSDGGEDVAVEVAAMDSVSEDAGGPSQQPLYVVRDGQRFKKREAEILDGMRPWGDFLDLDGSPWSALGTAAGGTGKYLRGVRVRVEPSTKQ